MNENFSEQASKSARFDVRLTKEQKHFYEKAVHLGGFRSLTDFVIHATREKAEMVVSKHEQVIASERDKVTFFEEIAKPQEPARALVDAQKQFEFLFLEE